MEPLNLTLHPPRSPRERLGGLCMLPRTIDKIRATLPGGDPGVYQLAGFSQRILDALGIDAEELTAVVRDAKTEDEVVAWVREHSDPSTYGELNESYENRKQSDIPPERRSIFDSKYDEDVRQHDNLFDMLDADDRKMFAK